MIGRISLLKETLPWTEADTANSKQDADSAKRSKVTDRDFNFLGGMFLSDKTAIGLFAISKVN
jgi:hypothetical protein